MDQASFVEHGQSVEQLRRKHPDQAGAETLERVLLDELVQVGREQLQHQAQVLCMDKRVFEAQDVMLVVGVPVSVEHLEHGDLHHTLIEVGGLVLDDLDRDNFVGGHVLTLDNLTEGALTQDVEDEILVAFLGAEPVVDVENVIALFVVPALVLHGLARLGEHTSRVEAELVEKGRIDEVVGVMQVRRQRFEWTNKATSWIGSPRCSTCGCGSGFAVRDGGGARCCRSTLVDDGTQVVKTTHSTKALVAARGTTGRARITAR